MLVSGSLHINKSTKIECQENSTGAVPWGQALQDAPDMEAQAEVFKVPVVGPKTNAVFLLDIEWANKHQN